MYTGLPQAHRFANGGPFDFPEVIIPMSRPDIFPANPRTTRRTFLGTGAAALAVGFCESLPDTAYADTNNPNMLGPLPGYAPQIGTFVSQLTWMREARTGCSARPRNSRRGISIIFSTRMRTRSAR